MRAIASATLVLFICISGVSGLWGMQESETYAQEYELYQKAEAETDAAKRRALLLEFVKTYKESALDPNVAYLYAQYYKPHQDRKQWQQLANLARGFLAHRPSDPTSARVATHAYQSLGDSANFQRFAQSTLRNDPNNLTMLIELSSSFWQGNNFAKASEYAKKGLSAATKAKKPQGQTDEQWKARLNQVRGFFHLAIGEQAYIQQKMVAARQNLEESVKYDTKSDLAHYHLGMVYWTTGKTQQAILELAKGFVLNGPSSKESRNQLNQLYKATYGNTNGLSNIIQKAREEVGG